MWHRTIYRVRHDVGVCLRNVDKQPIVTTCAANAQDQEHVRSGHLGRLLISKPSVAEIRVGKAASKASAAGTWCTRFRSDVGSTRSNECGRGVAENEKLAVSQPGIS